MKNSDPSLSTFFALIRSGLWEESLRLDSHGELDWAKIMQWANEQTVVGLIGAALEHLEGVKPPRSFGKECLAQVMGIAARNEQLNAFLCSQAKEFAAEGVVALVLKGQGVARCYSRPMWRQSGDIDWLVDGDGYDRAREILLAKADRTQLEYEDLKHYAMHFGDIEVELHGTTHTALSEKIDRYHDDMQHEMFSKGVFREWNCSGQKILLPDINFDAIFIFTHFLHHFFHGGIGLRQLCDWTRFIHSYHGEIDRARLKKDLDAMNLMQEWRAFGALAVQWLGLDANEMPFYEARYGNRGGRIVRFIMKAGNFGHNQSHSQPKYKNYLHRKFTAFRYRIREIGQVFLVFPSKSLKYLYSFGLDGVRKIIRGK